jgi:hypothetical protein
MATRKRGAAIPEPSEQEAEAIARELVKNKSGLAGSEFKKELSSDLKKFDKKIITAAESLASKGELYRWSSARKVRFFETNPLDLLPPTIREVFAKGPTTEAELAKCAEAKHRGTQDLVKEWLKRAVSRGEVFPYPSASGSTAKRYWREPKRPDAAEVLKKIVVALKKALESPAGRHVTRETAIEALAKALGVEVRVVTANADKRQKFLAILAQYSKEQPVGALLSIRELRFRAGLDKQQFDTVALELQREGAVTLHHHDHPESDPDPSQLVVDERGTHYVGIALRGSL